MEKITCQGFTAAGRAAGLKKNGNKDLGLIFSDTPAAAAAVFTRNRVQAAPVVVCRERISIGQCQAVVVNSGNANCCTGAEGLQNAREMARCAAETVGISEESVLVASTGVIGAQLPIGKIAAAMPALGKELRPDGFVDFAEAIMTTDTVPKVVRRSGRAGDGPFNVVGVAKGSGMIRPDLATMLCFVCSDVRIAAADLQQCLESAVETSFNRITVDGDTSTNDTVLMMANGMSGTEIQSEQDRRSFQRVLDAVLMQLARMLIKDAEGATKLVEVLVAGALCDDDALQVALTVADSNLVKTAFFGEDANWGRILAAAGRSGAPLDPERVDIYFDDVKMVADGVGCGAAAEAAATRVMQQDEFTVKIDLNLGRGSASILTCDFSIDYVKINADYRS